MGLIKNLVRDAVSLGVGMISYNTTKGLANKYVPRRAGALGTITGVCTTAAAIAVSYKASETMEEYVEEKFDKTKQACKDIMKTLNEMHSDEEDKDDGREEKIEHSTNPEATAAED